MLTKAAASWLNINTAPAPKSPRRRSTTTARQRSPRRASTSRPLSPIADPEPMTTAASSSSSASSAPASPAPFEFLSEAEAASRLMANEGEVLQAARVTRNRALRQAAVRRTQRAAAGPSPAQLAQQAEVAAALEQRRALAAAADRAPMSGDDVVAIIALGSQQRSACAAECEARMKVRWPATAAT
jgi:hypothetical protein